MKVNELIVKLQLLDQDADVVIASSNFELRNADVDASSVHQYDDALKTTKTFMGAFDYENYQKETWSVAGGTSKIVYIS